MRRCFGRLDHCGPFYRVGLVDVALRFRVFVIFGIERSKNIGGGRDGDHFDIDIRRHWDHWRWRFVDDGCG